MVIKATQIGKIKLIKKSTTPTRWNCVPIYSSNSPNDVYSIFFKITRFWFRL